MIKKWMAGPVLMLAMTATAAWADAAPGAGEGLGQRLAQVYIAPAMGRFQQAAAYMGETLQGVCAETGGGGAPAARAGDEGRDRKQGGMGGADAAAAFERLVEAWGGIEFLRFGPLVDANRFERIYFWPDPRGVTTRQVQGMLAKPATDIPDARALSSHSVALQGLPALEFVLFRDKGLLSGDQGADRSSQCAYALAVAGNLQRLGDELVEQWGDGGDQARVFARPGPENPLYRNTEEVASEVVKALSTGLQFQADIKLAPALGASLENANERKAPFWRSGLAAVSVESAVRGMLAFYDAGGYQYPNAQWIDQNIRGELQRAADYLAGLRHGNELFRMEDSHRELMLVTLLLRNAKDIIDQHMAPALGVRIGFNALDGD